MCFCFSLFWLVCHTENSNHSINIIIHYQGFVKKKKQIISHLRFLSGYGESWHTKILMFQSRDREAFTVDINMILYQDPKSQKKTHTIQSGLVGNSPGSTSQTSPRFCFGILYLRFVMLKEKCVSDFCECFIC